MGWSLIGDLPTFLLTANTRSRNEDRRIRDMELAEFYQMLLPLHRRCGLVQFLDGLGMCKQVLGCGSRLDASIWHSG